MPNEWAPGSGSAEKISASFLRTGGRCCVEHGTRQDSICVAQLPQPALQRGCTEHAEVRIDELPA